jgi:VWFA-related protein
MRKLALCLLLASLVPGAFAARRVTVEQLERVLATSLGKPDTEFARKLADLELVERLNSARLQSLKARLPGVKSQQVLLALADASAFLDPPAIDIPATSTPDQAAQRRMMSLTVNYIGKSLPLLPNLFATRSTERFENNPSVTAASLLPENPLHPAGISTATVLYRDGHEYLDPGVAKDNKPQSPDKGLTTWGEFGPILGTVLIDAARSQLSWSHWELGANGPEAVFSYSVPKEKSHYDVRFCCVAESYGLEINVLRQRAGYHGQLTVDPADGTILRLTVEADLDPDSPIRRASIAVEYAPVQIGGKTYVCPARSIALAVAPDLKALHDMLFPAGQPSPAQPLPSLQKASRSNFAEGPQQTLLNDVDFRQYHLFRAEARVVPNPPEETARLATPAPPGAPAEFTNTTTTSVPEKDTAAESGAASVQPAAEPAPPPPPPAPPEPVVPEISVVPATGLPDGPRPAQSAPPDSGFTLRITSRLVDLGVVALDKKGHPVTNLKPEDFEIYDNGAKQDLRSFGQTGVLPAAPAAPDKTPPPAATDQPAFSNRHTSAATAPAGPSDTNTTILLLDAGNLSFGDLTNAREQMLRFLRAQPSTERTALYLMKAAGFQVLVEGTTDHALLADKLAAWRPSAQDVSNGQDQEQHHRQLIEMVDNMEDLLNVNGHNEMDPGTQYQPLDRQLRDYTQNPGQEALLELVNVARHLATLQGHKSLVWVTSDNVLADWNKMSVTIDKGSKFIEVTALRTQEAMNDAHVSVYPLDASRLEAAVIDASIGQRNVELNPTNNMINVPLLEQEMQGPEYTAGQDLNTQPQRDLAPGRLTAAMQQDLHPIQGAFREVAEATGGRVFRRSSDITGELNGVVAEGRATYLLSFSPRLPADDKYHLLTVKLVNQKNISLRYRTGYLYTQQPAALKDRFRRAVWQPEDATDIALTADPVPASNHYVVKLGIAAADLGLAQQGDLWADKLDVFLVRRDDAGMHAQVTGQILGLRLKPATYQKYLREGIPFEQPLDTGAGKGSVRLLVVDENSGRIGSVTIPAAAIDSKM